MKTKKYRNRMSYYDSELCNEIIIGINNNKFKCWCGQKMAYRERYVYTEPILNEGIVHVVILCEKCGGLLAKEIKKIKKKVKKPTETKEKKMKVCKLCGGTEEEHCIFDPIEFPDDCVCDVMTWLIAELKEIPPICDHYISEPDTGECDNCYHQKECHKEFKDK